MLCLCLFYKLFTLILKVEILKTFQQNQFEDQLFMCRRAFFLCKSSEHLQAQSWPSVNSSSPAKDKALNFKMMKSLIDFSVKKRGVGQVCVQLSTDLSVYLIFSYF